MAAGKSSQTRWEPCRLVANPTGNAGAALSGSYPFGGTELGNSREILWARGLQRIRLIGEEYGGKTIRSSFREASAVLACNGRGWDPDFIATLPGGSSADGGTITRNHSTSKQPGTWLTRIKLLLVPDDETNGIALILYAASVLPAMTEKVRRSYSHEFGVPVLWEAEIDDTGRDWKEGKLSTIVV